MTTEEAQKVLNELDNVRPEVLNGEAKRLFEAIMKIADERDELKTRVKEQELEISLWEKTHNYDVKMIDDVKGRAVKFYNQLEEKDKEIDLMVEILNNYDIDEDICKQVVLEKGECNEFEEKSVCIECIKKYFENKAKEDKQ